MEVFASPALFQGFFLIFVRCTAVFLTAPVFGSRSFPAIGKIGLGLFLAMLLLPLNSDALTEVSPDFLMYLFLIGQELLTGLLIGFAVHVVFSAVQFAASLIGLQIGFSLANVYDPSFNSQTTIVDQFYVLIATLIFVAVNGHQQLIVGLQRSFDIVPLVSLTADEALMERLVSIFVGTFSVALRISLPVIAALLLADVALGLLGRTVPTLNILVVGLPLKILVGVVVVALSLPFVGSLLTGLFSQTSQQVVFLLQGR